MQFLVLACALLGVALGQYAGYPAGYQGYYGGYQGYPGFKGYGGALGYSGYQGYPGYQGYQGYQGYPGYQGYAGYPGYQGYQGYRGYPQVVAPVKPLDPKDKDVIKTVIPAPVIPAPVIPAPIIPAPVFPAIAPYVPVVPKAVYSGPYIAIRSQTQDSSPDGSYSYSYQTENGINAAESGAPRVGPNGAEEVVAGEYSYTAPDGTPVYVRYTADGNGFHPQGTHIARYAGYAGGARALPVIAPVEDSAEESKETPEKKEE